MSSVDKFSILGLSAVLLFAVSVAFYYAIGMVQFVLNLCYLTLLILGIGLLLNKRLIFGVGLLFAAIPLLQVLFRIIGLLSYAPKPFTLALGYEVVVHTITFFIAIVGALKKFRYLHRHTWWVSSILLVVIWLLTYFFADPSLNISYTSITPPFMEPLGIWGFAFLTLGLAAIYWYVANKRYSEPEK